MTEPYLFRPASGTLRSTLLAAAGAWLDHGFGTRLSPRCWPPPAGGYEGLKQVHSDIVVAIGAPGNRQAEPLSTQSCGPQEGDALITAAPGSWIGVRTADCVPILIADPVRRAVAAVHSGWRGTAAGIAAKAIGRLTVEFGSQPSDCLVAIGPAIGPCCYEVGADVAAEFTRGVRPATGVAGKAYLDLGEILVDQFLDAGVPRSNVDRLGTRCTRCESALFHSYRRESGVAGRMISAIRIR